SCGPGVFVGVKTFSWRARRFPRGTSRFSEGQDVISADKTFFLETGRSRKKIRRLENLLNVESPGRGKGGEKDAGIAFKLFFKKVHHHRFGIDADEFLSQHTIEPIDIAGMDAETVVDHREMAQAFAVKPIHRQ